MAKKTKGGKSNNKRKHHESPLTQQYDEDSPDGRDEASKPRKKEKRKSKKALKDEQEERRLTALLFGNASTSVPDDHEKQRQKRKKEARQQPTVTASEEEGDDDEEGDAGVMFEIDRTGVDEDSPPATSTAKGNQSEKQAAENDSDDDNDDDDSDSVAASDDDDSAGPAWVDEDDDNVQVDVMETSRLRKLRTSRDETQPLRGDDLQRRLRARYKSTMQATAHTEWAKLDEDDDGGNDEKQNDEEDDNIQLSSQPLLLQGSNKGSSKRLAPNILNVMRCPDANQSDYNKAVVQAVHFHPGSDPDQPLLLTAGLDKTLRFFQVSAEQSEKVHGIHFPKLPIYSASFLGDTGKVVVSGRRPFFYIYDSIAGKLDHIPKISGREEKSLEKCVSSPDGKLIAFVGNDGYVILVDVHSKQWLANLKLNGSVRAITFTADGEYILASGSDGDVYRWEVKSRRCVERFANQDGTITSYLAASTRRHLAVGSESGVVNLYSDERRPFGKQKRKQQNINVAKEPIKSIMNLQTSADMVRFNHDGQILAMSSRREKNSLKLLHVPTATVFANWPTSKTPLQYIWSMDFSPQSKFLAMGNDKGKCLLYSLKHYS